MAQERLENIPPDRYQWSTQAILILPQLGPLALRRVIISAGGEPRTVHESPSSVVSSALTNTHSATATLLHLI